MKRFRISILGAMGLVLVAGLVLALVRIERRMVRTGLEHSFLPGSSLWQQGQTGAEKFDRPVAACSEQMSRPRPSGECARYLQSNEKARQQWELERRFHSFEASF